YADHRDLHSSPTRRSSDLTSSVTHILSISFSLSCTETHIHTHTHTHTHTNTHKKTHCVQCVANDITPIALNSLRRQRETEVFLGNSLFTDDVVICNTCQGERAEH